MFIVHQYTKCVYPDMPQTKKEYKHGWILEKS